MPSFLSNLLEKAGVLSTEEPGEAVVLEIVEEQAAEEAPTEPVKPTIRRLSLKGLLEGTIDADASAQEAALAKDVGLDVAWKTIFETAGVVVPPHGWTVERALALIRKSTSQGMTPMEARRALEEALAVERVDVREVARDAVAKDEVLDLYEKELEANVTEELEELGAEIEELEARISGLRTRIGEIEEERASLTRRLTAWKSEKRHLEQQWAKVLHIVAPLM
jgi:DNA repair exonuclease SbcCD ATPase subunit